MTETAENFDLVVVGTGSGNSVLTPDFDDWRVALIERDTFGGTCLNRGCIPSKMFVYAADMAHQAGHTGPLGVDTSLDGVRWPEIVDRVFGRIDPIAQGGEDYRHSLDNVTVFNGDARFTGHKMLEVNGQQITGNHIVLAAGARPFIPPIPGLDEIPYHTSDTVMRLETLPDRMVILGGGYIAAEMGHVFDAMGVSVTIVNRSERLLRAEDEDISAAFTEIATQRMDCALGSPIVGVSQSGSQVTVSTEARNVTGDVLLVATGRVPNGEQLGVTRSDIELDDDGYVVTDEFLRTGVDGVWALGDICHAAQLKHTANEDTRAVAHNIAHPDDLRAPDHSGIPHAVFAYPHVAAVGATEQSLRAEGRPYLRALRPYSDTAYGWAMEDTASFAKVLADPDTRLLLGAHIIGPQAPTLIQQLIQGMQFGLTVDQMARGQLFIHPALTEVVEQALLEL
ncbi:mycothione reductase [Candidatus Poriferisocius sp.]|uniref:mycothione reductase n=1 Tax=Candidatus Poriferisocius sp. TaxID=3101276 RepID=UPI003B023C70